jgi:hypothetical protein
VLQLRYSGARSPDHRFTADDDAGRSSEMRRMSGTDLPYGLHKRNGRNSATNEIHRLGVSRRKMYGGRGVSVLAAGSLLAPSLHSLPLGWLHFVYRNRISTFHSFNTFKVSQSISYIQLQHPGHSRWARQRRIAGEDKRNKDSRDSQETSVSRKWEKLSSLAQPRRTPLDPTSHNSWLSVLTTIL